MTRLDGIKPRMQEFIDQKQISGMVGMVVRDGKLIWSDARGLANIKAGTPMKVDTIFRVMSMTKPVTAIAVMICVERGLVRLDDPVQNYIPQLKGVQVELPDGTKRAPSKPMTVRQLLNHTSGLSGNDPGGLSDDAKVKLTLKQYSEQFANTTLKSDPGTEIAYSGPGMAAAGRIVEVVSKKTFDKFLQDEVFGPLAMKDTFFFAPKEKHDRIAWMYDTTDRGLEPLGDPFNAGAKYPNPGGGLYSTAADMAKLLTCFVQGGKSGTFRLLSPASVKAMTHLTTGSLLQNGSDAQGYGIGFSIVRSAAGGQHLKAVGNFGHVGAFNTDYWADPDTKMVVVFMSQTWDETPRKTFNTMVNASFVGP